MKTDEFFDKCMPEPNSGCWIWMGACDGVGYGRVWHYEGRGKYDYRRFYRLAHRESYALHCGEIRAEDVVMHQCDTPSCVNPSHLRLGTAKDNVRDMIAKGRKAKIVGADHHATNLTDEAVRDIRSGQKRGAEYARIYGVSPQAVNHIQKRRTWKHVA